MDDLSISFIKLVNNLIFLTRSQPTFPHVFPLFPLNQNSFSGFLTVIVFSHDDDDDDDDDGQADNDDGSCWLRLIKIFAPLLPLSLLACRQTLSDSIPMVTIIN